MVRVHIYLLRLLVECLLEHEDVLLVLLHLDHQLLDVALLLAVEARGLGVATLLGVQLQFEVTQLFRDRAHSVSREERRLVSSRGCSRRL